MIGYFFSQAGQMQVYIDGHLKNICSNIAKGSELSQAGDFVLGQSHEPDAYLKRRRSNGKQKGVELDARSRQILFDLYSSDRSGTASLQHEDEQMIAAIANPDESSIFDERMAFVGRLFNFNVWDRVPNNVAEFLKNIVNDCRLIFCGNAAQW